MDLFAFQTPTPSSPRQNLVIDHLKLLWLADGDPKRTYADEERELRALAESRIPKGVMRRPRGTCFLPCYRLPHQRHNVRCHVETFEFEFQANLWIAV